jgi:hypothetical protein
MARVWQIYPVQAVHFWPPAGDSRVRSFKYLFQILVVGIVATPLSGQEQAKSHAIGGKLKHPRSFQRRFVNYSDFQVPSMSRPVEPCVQC